MVSGALFLAGPFFFNLHFLPSLSDRDQPVLYALFGVSLVAALLLVPVGMVGFHALQRHTYGRIGRAFFWLVVVGSLVVVLGGVVFFILGESGDFLQTSPPLVWVALGLLGMVGGLVSMVMGFALYGVATLQARVLPRWCGVAFIVAVPGALASSIALAWIIPASVFTSVFIVFGIVWLALGYELWARREAPPAQQPRRVR
jgi:uncharacterized membrane protein YhaH (DUF805 family)